MDSGSFRRSYFRTQCACRRRIIRTWISAGVWRYQMIDMVPPGPVSLLMGVMAKPRISHVGQGVLAIDGISPEPALLYPDGEIGRYRVVSPFANGARAIIEQRDDGLHLWSSI